MNSNKAQHEIIGFVLIVVLVTIVGIFFLSFSPNEESKVNSAEVVKLLESGMLVTTECSTSYIPQYKELQDLIKECYRNELTECLDGIRVCESLLIEYKELLDESLKVSEIASNKAYKSRIYDESNELLNIESGNYSACSRTIGGKHPIAVTSFGSGLINVELEICKG